jgi:predicted 2-oxoglutarate/Fe(II)-dependent dioxygenase YbiX
MTVVINNFFPGELQPSTIIGGCIAIYENAWPNPENTIKMVENTVGNLDSGVFWQRAETTQEGANQTHRTNKMMGITHLAGITNNAALQNVHNQFYMLLLAASIPYAKRFNIKETLWHEHYQILKYSQGEEYKGHYDGGTSIGRSISCLCYLNEDFEGGELEFPNFHVKIKPEPGMLILFPSNYAYLHIAHPVTSGTKYSMVTWIRDREI